MRFFVALAIILSTFTLTTEAFSPADSVGVEKINGKVFILHRVEEKETLYSLSRRYNVAIARIIESNPKSEFGLDIGEILKIPYIKKLPVEDGRVVHVVKPSETLYSIAKQYEVEVEDIKKWNHMSMSLLDIGQELLIYPEGKQDMTPSMPVKDMPEAEFSQKNTMHTVLTGETLYSISRKYNTPLDKLRAWNNLAVNDISIGQELIVKKDTLIEAPAPEVASELPENKVPPTALPRTDTAYARQDSANPVVSYTNEVEVPMSRENENFEEVEEAGLAQLIDGATTNKKYLALHRTAKVGTIMRVRNEMNGQEVFVRVIGQLPDTGANRNVLIKISKAAYDQLGAIDSRFRVRISYIP